MLFRINFIFLNSYQYMDSDQAICKRTQPPKVKWRWSRSLFLYLAMTVSAFTATRAEEKSFTTAATVTALYDDWDTTSSSLQSLLDGSYKANVRLKNNVGTSGDLSGTKGFRIDFGQS